MRFLTFILLLYSSSYLAQNDTSSYHFFGIKSGIGFVIAHEPSMEFFTNQRVEKYELNYERKTYNENSPLKKFNFPRVGISLNYFDFNNDVLGKGYSLLPYISFNAIRTNRFKLKVKPGIGIGYLTKTFDIESNLKNSAIGSQVNIFVSVILESEIKISETINLLMSSSFSHFSNTSFQTPNLGINIPTLEAGISYRLKQHTPLKSDFSTYQSYVNNWNLSVAGGLNENYPALGKKYVALLLSAAREWNLNEKYSIGLTGDFFHNWGHPEELAIDSVTIKNGFENLQIGSAFQFSTHFGRLNSFIQAGIYLKNANTNLKSTYQIVGAKYNINSKYAFLVAFKTHLATAEFISVGINKKIGTK